MPDRSDAADRLSGVLADELGCRPADRGNAGGRSEASRVGSMCAAGQHEQRRPVGVEDQRVGDGPHLAAELGSGGRRSRGGLGEDDDLPGCAVLGQDVGDPPDVGVQFGSHGPDSTAIAVAARWQQPLADRAGEMPLWSMFRLLGLLGGLAAVTDLGVGAASDESLRRCVVATRLARAAGCDADQVRDVVFVSLLQHIGCTAFSHEAGAVWGDDIASGRLAFLMDFSDPRDLFRVWVPGLAAATGRSRARVLATTVRSMRGFDAAGPVATCDVAREASSRLGLPETVRQGLVHALCMWNGKGHPRRSGEDIPLATRLMHVASIAVLFLMHAGRDAALAELRRRSGSYLDPALVDLFVDHAGELLDGVESADAYEAALDCEPDPVQLVDRDDLESVARTFGDLVDLKSPRLHGHSSAVADLAAAAAGGLGLAGDVHSVRVAGHVHDIGRVAVSSRIWDKADPLSATERDQANLHPYHGERILARIPELAEVAILAGQHHERCDGSGYHRGIGGDRMSMASRVLATADAYCSATANNGAATADSTAKWLRDEARHGRLDADAVEAVLEVAGHQRQVRRQGPAGLTSRQIEVLRLVASGLSNRDIAERLVISPRTAEHHVQDVYARIGASTRAAAALFAMEHGLLGPREGSKIGRSTQAGG